MSAHAQLEPSRRARPGTFEYDETRRLTRALTDLGCDIVTGRGPGLMRQAANEGAAEAAPPRRTDPSGSCTRL